MQRAPSQFNTVRPCAKGEQRGLRCRGKKMRLMTGSSGDSGFSAKFLQPTIVIISFTGRLPFGYMLNESAHRRAVKGGSAIVIPSLECTLPQQQLSPRSLFAVCMRASDISLPRTHKQRVGALHGCCLVARPHAALFVSNRP